MPNSVKVITPPEEELISLTEAKLHLKVDHDADDTLIEALIPTVIERAQIETDSYLLTQEIEFRLDRFPCSDVIEVPGPLQTIDKIEYYDEDNTLVEMDSDEYFVDIDSNPPRVVLHPDYTWQPTYNRPAAVVITATVGYAADRASLPATVSPIISAMLLDLGAFYENREAITQFTNLKELPLPWTVKSILFPFRIHR